MRQMEMDLILEQGSRSLQLIMQLAVEEPLTTSMDLTLAT